MVDDALPERTLPLPGQHPSTVAVAAPGEGDGFWAGGPSAAVDEDGAVFLAHRLRRPVGDGRGFAVAISRSEDGWRVYLSLATPGTLHWRVVAIDADHPAGFVPEVARTVLDGGPHRAFKDTVVHPGPDGWEMWACLHQVADPDLADAMTTVHATSPDGLVWTLTGTVLEPAAGPSWDRRGTRLTAVVDVDGQRHAYYDGRATYAENWEERTGVATADEHGRFHARPGGPWGTSPHATGSLRYVDVIEVPGGLRLYYEASRPDGAHDLLTEYAPRPS